MRNIEILLVGDTSGNADEGMKIIGKNISTLFRENHYDINAKYINSLTLVKNIFKYDYIHIIHFIGGPTWKTILLSYIVKRILRKRPVTILSFIHPKWNKYAQLTYKVFPPDHTIVQSNYWEQICSNYTSNIVRIPLSAVNQTKFHSVSKKKKMEIRVKLNLPLDKLIVLHVGHINEGRNIRSLVKIANNEKYFPIVIGSTTTKLNKLLISDMEEAGIKVITQYILKIEEYYQASDCYIFPTTDHAHCIQIPLSILEALFCKIPVLSAHFSDLPVLLPPNKFPIRYIRVNEDIVKEIESAMKISLNYNYQKNYPLQSWKELSFKLNSYYYGIIREP